MVFTQVFHQFYQGRDHILKTCWVYLLSYLVYIPDRLKSLFPLTSNATFFLFCKHSDRKVKPISTLLKLMFCLVQKSWFQSSVSCLRCRSRFSSSVSSSGTRYTIGRRLDSGFGGPTQSCVELAAGRTAHLYGDTQNAFIHRRFCYKTLPLNPTG